MPARRLLARITAVIPPLFIAVGCGELTPPAANSTVLAPHYSSFDGAEWSTPVAIGAPVNSAAGEMNAAFSPDELSLYFTSADRPGGMGGNDIWVSRRACVDCPWTVPVNLGPPVNTSSGDAGPRLSNDGHLLFFQSDRPGSQGLDIYVSHRANPNDDFGWAEPVLLGPGVNTPDAEQAAAYLQSAEDGAGNLYFNRGLGTGDLYYAAVKRNGETRGPAVIVAELNSPTVDQHATIRKDGREVYFSSLRAGGFGGFDIYVSTRRSVHDPWSTPANVGSPLNTAMGDMQPSLSADGRTLLFASTRAGGLGTNDLWISTRRPGAY